MHSFFVGSLHPIFVETISGSGAVMLVIVSGIMILALFFKGLAFLGSVGEKPGVMAVRGVLKQDTLATVNLTGGRKFERVRFVGFTNNESFKTHLPFELNGMVILEDETKQRFLIRARDIVMITVEPEVATRA